LRNFLRVFFFFADFVGRSNGLAKAVAHMIRLRAQPEHFFSGDRLSRVMLESYLFYSPVGLHPLSPIFHPHLLPSFVSIFTLFHPLSPSFTLFHPLSPSFTLTFHSFICALFTNKGLFLHNRRGRGRERERERKGSEGKGKGNGSGCYKSVHAHNSSMKPP
jgi:hypothetical protein